MLAGLNRLIGNRLPLANETDNTVELFAWYHPIYAPAYHVALRVTHGKEVEYLSISPTVHPNFSGSTLFDLRNGFPAHFIACYEDELLIQGFRNAWPDGKNTLSEKQQSLITDDTLKKVTDREIFNIASLYPEATQTELRLKGNPAHVVRLRSLDAAPMIEKIRLFKSPENKTKWALWSGNHIQKDNTYNCASSAYSVLSAGGFNHLVESNRDLFGLAGALLGATYAYTHNQNWQTAMKNIVISTLLARGVSGAYEGYTGIQSYLNFNASKGKNSFSAAIGLRLLSTTLSGFIGAILPGPVVPAVIAMPADMLQAALEAKREEDGRFTPAYSHQPTLHH